MEESDLIERRLDSESVYDGVLLHVRRDAVQLPDGKQSVREYVVHPGAVAILPLFDDGRILMERQYRYPLQETMIEIPAGKIDPGEDTLDAAKRELLEETGHVAAEWTHLTTMHPICAYSTERVEIWLARGLECHAEPKLDEGEFLETFRVAHYHALEWVRDGRISDAKTIIAIQWADNILSGKWPVASTRPKAPRRKIVT